MDGVIGEQGLPEQLSITGGFSLYNLYTQTTCSFNQAVGSILYLLLYVHLYVYSIVCVYLYSRPPAHGTP